jgi:outer membrane protein assembly factor BamD
MRPDDRETQRVRSPIRSRAVRLAILLVAVVPMAACDTIANLNPFDKQEAYKPEIVPTVPAETLYNEGLAYMQKDDYESASKRFASLDRQYPFSTWAKKALIMHGLLPLRGAAVRRHDRNTSRRFLQLHPIHGRRGLRGSTWSPCRYFNQIPDVTRDQERAEKGSRRAPGTRSTAIPTPNTRPMRASSINVDHARSARGQGDGGRTVLPARSRNYTGVHQPVPQRRQPSIRRRTARSRRPWPGSPRPIMALGIVNEAQTAAAVLGHNFPDRAVVQEHYLLQASSENPARIFEPAGDRRARRLAGTPSCPRPARASVDAPAKASRDMMCRGVRSHETADAQAVLGALATASAMLVQLAIRDIVLIDRLELAFGSGLERPHGRDRGRQVHSPRCVLPRPRRARGRLASCATAKTQGPGDGLVRRAERRSSRAAHRRYADRHRRRTAT